MASKAAFFFIQAAGRKLAAAIAYFILQHKIIKAGGEESELKQALGSDTKGKVSLVAYTVGIALAWFVPIASVAIYTGVALMWFIPDKRIERHLGS